jgi:hypothetical protein
VEDDERVKAYIEMWKQAVDVQKHFNDIEMRIRGLALTALTFALGGATLAVKDARTTVFFGLKVQLGAVVLVAGLIVWLGFYFMDQVWYHRLLIGAVVYGERLEEILRVDLPEAGLTKSISTHSVYPLRLKLGKRQWKYDLRSKQKIRIFYLLIAAILLVLAILTQFGARS